ncbi:MAG: elongation factor G [Gemmatimonas sp.]|nr:elongation factor G [Gemmatimonas sp.]
MRDYDSAGIRNIAVVGHGASGKTSLVDALCFAAGSGKRHGSTKDGTALTDHLPEEIERGYSISLGCAFAEWQESKINFIDTPSSLDFQGDAIAGLAAADGALCVIGAASGVEVGTERMFRAAVARQDPVLFVVSMMDKEHADFNRVYQQIKDRLTSKVIPVEIPCGEGANFQGVINLFTQRAYMYTTGVKGEYVEQDIPAECRAQFETYRRELIEAISATNDTLLERYLDGQEIDRDTAIHGMKDAMARRDLFPLFCVSSDNMIGVRALLTELVQLMPNAYEMEEIHALTGAEGHNTVQLHARDDGPFAALVFKTLNEPHVGEVTYFRVLSGKVDTGQDVFNATRDSVEKLGHLSVPFGKERIEVTTLHAGDIGCVAKLRNTHTNDTLSTREHPVRLPGITYPETVVHFAVRATIRGEEDKLQQGLHRLHDEDPTLTVHYHPETHETIVGGMGERHLDVAMSVLRRKFGVNAELAKPRIAYRETITARAEGQGRHKKQSGGRGQFGDCWIRMGPMPRGEGYLFDDKIVGGAIPSKYVPAVDRGVQEAAARGVLAGFPLVDFRVEVYDGSTHSVDSNEMSFRMAGIQAFKSVAGKCRPVILEPLDLLEITVPDAFLGDVLGDLSGRRRAILGTESDGRQSTIRAVVPQAELHLYATQLFSLTHGYGMLTRRFSGYEQMPHESAQRVIAEHVRELEAADV